MLRINSCGTTSLTGLSNLSMTGPTGPPGPVGVKSHIKNYIITPKSPYININANPVPLNVNPDPPELVLTTTTPPSINVESGYYVVTSVQGNARGIKNKITTPMLKPEIRPDIPVYGGGQQPVIGILHYTLGPLDLPQFVMPFFPNYVEIPLPFQVQYDNTLYGTIYVYGNSYITFGSVFELSSLQFDAGINGFNPPIPSIFVGASNTLGPVDLYYGLENNTSNTSTGKTFRIRFDSTRESVFADSTPIIWEVVFYANDPSRIDISAEIIDFFGVTGLSSGNGFITNFFLTSNSGVTCTPQGTNYKNINVTSNNITTVQDGDDFNVQINAIAPLVISQNLLTVLVFSTTNDIITSPNPLILQSPFDTTVNSSIIINMSATGGNISMTPTFESTDGPGGYVDITNPSITTTGTSNIEFTVDGFCKLIV